MRTDRSPSTYNQFQSYKSFARDKENFDGSTEWLFNEQLVRLLDDAFLHNNMDILSNEQRLMIKKYFAEAEKGTTNHNPLQYLSEQSKQLDIYLGGLYGRDDS